MTGSDNVALGFASLYSNTSGDLKIAIGMEASLANISENKNIIASHKAHPRLNSLEQ